MKENFIGGKWIATENTVENINPSDTGDVIGLYASADAAQAEQAVAAAAGAAAAWGQSTPLERHKALGFVARELTERSAEIGDMLAREEGKTRAEGVGETLRAAQIFDFFAGEALRQTGEMLPSVRPGIDVTVTREALGVVGLITPWNFPIAIPAWKIAPALCHGNTVVFKPAELTPGCAWILAEILSRSGLPDGVFNLVMGSGRVVGEVLTGHDEVAAVSFTGSVATGRRIAENCARSFKKVQLEMGGKNPLVVLDDADLETAVECALNGAFFSTGQRCTASSRLIVTDGIHDRFVARLVERMQDLVIGDARADGTHIGPLADKGQLEKSLRYIDTGQSEGATLAQGGQAVEAATPGFYLEPALFTNAGNDMAICREEIFGPVAAVIRAAGYEEALALANDTEFGLSAGICTSSLKHARHFQRHSQAGMTMVNLPTAGVDFHVPFGGRKGSSYGAREQGRYAAEFYTVVKTSYVGD